MKKVLFCCPSGQLLVAPACRLEKCFVGIGSAPLTEPSERPNKLLTTWRLQRQGFRLDRRFQRLDALKSCLPLQ